MLLSLWLSSQIVPLSHLFYIDYSGMKYTNSDKKVAVIFFKC